MNIVEINHIRTYAFYTRDTVLYYYNLAFLVKGSSLEVVNLLTFNGCKCEQWNMKKPAHR